MRKYLIAAAIVMLFITGCAQKGEPAPAKPEPASDQAARPSRAEMKEGDFVYRLVSESERYGQGEKPKIYAELEYVGEQDEITIGHAASPFYFPMKELTRNYSIDYMMNEPYITTTLKKGEPLREDYTGSGGYSEQDTKDYQNFIRSLKDGFPEGRYVVYGSADFVIHPAEGETGEEPEKYKIQAEIEFEVSP